MPGAWAAPETLEEVDRQGRAGREGDLRRDLVVFLANGRRFRPFREASWSL